MTFLGAAVAYAFGALITYGICATIDDMGHLTDDDSVKTGVLITFAWPVVLAVLAFMAVLVSVHWFAVRTAKIIRWVKS